MISNVQTPVLIYGAGGLAREVAWVLSMPGSMLRWPDDRDPSTIEVVGHLDDNTAIHGTLVNGRAVVGGSEWLADRSGHAVVVAVGNPAARKGIVERLRGFGASFPSILSPQTITGERVDIGEGVIVLPGVVVTCDVRIGDFVLLNPHVSISHDGHVSDYCSLGPGVSLAGNVRVGSGTDIGTNSSIIPGVRIGRNVVVGAGACVVRDLADGVLAYGVPAKGVVRP